MTRAGDADLRGAAEDLAARMPEPLAPLAHLAFNYRWSWSPDGIEVFRSVDGEGFDRCGGNPVQMLREARATDLDRAAADPELVERARAALEELRSELDRPPNADRIRADRPVAFFCAEFAVHRSLPEYAGGLGVLAGDILKEASDLALPFVGVGLLYREGNFHQRLDRSGWQHEYWAPTAPERLPSARVIGTEGRPLAVRVQLHEREVVVQIWRVDIGRVPLYLLDADHPDNDPADRWITARLYVGDRELRLAQYALLGIGGMRALRAMGIDPGVIHLNEGHAAFAALELACEGLSEGLPFADALAAARGHTVFTTHTPVPAGNETYEREELLGALGRLTKGAGIDPDELLALGRVRPEDPAEPFGLTPFAIRMSRSVNGVSARHGEVARQMWHPMFPDRSEDEVPIVHVTNAVHAPTWMSPPMRALLDRHLPDGWRERAGDPARWDAVDTIPDEELWDVRGRLRADLVAYLGQRDAADRLGRGEPIERVTSDQERFDPGTLTIGFARRLATYKRLDLLIHDVERAIRLLEGPPGVQVVLAGKAHPTDDAGKRLLSSLFEARPSRGPAHRVAFLEDYDLGVAERLVWGCDVWVNLPRAPLEASGTSGMKSVLNGGLNLSVLDGWWREAFDGTNGWGIASEPGDPSVQDDRDAESFYSALEREVLPLYHDRDAAGVPRGWVARIKASLRTCGPRFAASRMLGEYVERIY